MKKLNKLTNEQKYSIADAIALANQQAFSSDFVANNYNKAFGLIINKPVTINGTTATLNEHLRVDDAKHVTALVLRKLQQTYVVARVEV